MKILLLFHWEPGEKSAEQVKIEFTGLRDGEKLVEELFYHYEEVGQTSFPKIKRARGPLQDWTALSARLEALESTLFVNGAGSVRTKIKDIVPEYSYLSDNESPLDRSVRRGSSGNAEARDYEAGTRQETHRAFAGNLTVVEPLFMIGMRGGAVW